jgi:hypothetical protein
MSVLRAGSLFFQVHRILGFPPWTASATARLQTQDLLIIVFL